jgi:hypothetical protein
MKRSMGIIIVVLAFLALAGGAYTLALGPGQADACNMGSPGGQDYVPQQRTQIDPTSPSGQSVTQEQAFDIVTSHIKRFNPNLEVGQVVDAGAFYEVEILSEDEVIERLAVDKWSGSLRPLF